MKYLLFAVFAIIACPVFLFAQSTVVQPSVSVVGEADLKIAPNQVSFTFEVVTTDPTIAAAKHANDVASAKTIAVAKTFKIADEDLQTDRLTIAPRMAGEKSLQERGTVIGYEVTKRIIVTLKQLERIDEFLASVINAGVNRIVNIDIENSELDKYQQQVRELAVDNARSKADAYAKRVGQKVGRAYVIREDGADTPGYITGTGNGWGDGNAAVDANPGDLSFPKAYSQPVTFALGKITVSDKIYVTFELRP